MEELKLYRTIKGLSPYPNANENLPLLLPIGKIQDKPLSRATIHLVVKRIFAGTAARLRAQGSEFEGEVAAVHDWQKPTVVIHATGRGSYQRTRLNRFGFPRGYLMRQKQVHGFQTGDRVKAVVTKGKKIGTYIGRVAVRASGNFNIQTETSVVQGIGHRYCTLIQRSDGYGYSMRADYY